LGSLEVAAGRRAALGDLKKNMYKLKVEQDRTGRVREKIIQLINNEKLSEADIINRAGRRGRHDDSFVTYIDGTAGASGDEGSSDHEGDNKLDRSGYVSHLGYFQGTMHKNCNPRIMISQKRSGWQRPNQRTNQK
jgi:hypothetical protein